MTWTYEHPLLYCLPALICLAIHVFTSAAFIITAKPGIFRFFLYLVSSMFLLIYVLYLNHCVTLATTKIEINFPGKYLGYHNQYGAVRITAQDLESIILVNGEKKSQGTIWIMSRQQTFYIDENFARFNEFLPLLGAVFKLPEPDIERNRITYLFKDNGPAKDVINISSRDNILRGYIPYFIPIMILYTILAYIWGQKGWQGNLAYFWRLGAVYTAPTVLLALTWPPQITALVLLLIYPLYPVFLAALCLPKQSRSDT